MEKCKAHWWKIAPSGGPVSLGVCKYCRETKQFHNSSDAQSMASAKKIRGRGQVITIRREAGEASGDSIMLAAVLGGILLVGYGLLVSLF